MASPEQDVRWLQRLSNYSQALGHLSEAVELAEQRPLTSLEQQGLIQAFEFTHELAWNVMKDYFYWQGNSAITGSRDATREALCQGLARRRRGMDGHDQEPQPIVAYLQPGSRRSHCQRSHRALPRTSRRL